MSTMLPPNTTLASSATPFVTDATFAAEVSRAGGVVAVEFTAEWCPPCRVMAPLVEAAARELGPSFRLLQMDADANQATMVRLGVRALPTLLVFSDGEVVERIVGTVSKAELRERLNRAAIR